MIFRPLWRRNNVLFVKINIMRTLTFLWLLGCLTLMSIAQTPREDAVRDAIWAHAYRTGMVGCTVAIAEKGKILYEYGNGFADLENLLPARPQTVYRIGSISKPITAVAVMQLVEQGKVDLDKDARVYVPEFPAKEHPFTVRQLLGHLSGIRHYKQNEGESTRPYPTVLESLDRFKEDPLLFKPGERYYYSTYAYTLLARVVENVSGLSFEEYLQKHLFDPANMKESYLEKQRAIIPWRARGYYRNANGEIQNSQLADMSYKWGGGGMLCTSADLCRFGMAILDQRLLKPETREMMWTAQTTNDGKKTTYGLGWTLQEVNGRAHREHGGAQAGARAFLAIVPEQELVVVVLTNYESHSPSELAREIVKRWLE